MPQTSEVVTFLTSSPPFISFLTHFIGNKHTQNVIPWLRIYGAESVGHRQFLLTGSTTANGILFSAELFRDWNFSVVCKRKTKDLLLQVIKVGAPINTNYSWYTGISPIKTPTTLHDTSPLYSCQANIIINTIPGSWILSFNATKQRQKDISFTSFIDSKDCKISNQDHKIIQRHRIPL